MFPSHDLLLIKVDNSIVDLAARRNGNDVGRTSGTGSLLRVLQPCHHLRLAGLIQGDRIEVDLAVFLADKGDSGVDFHRRERV